MAEHTRTRSTAVERLLAAWSLRLTDVGLASVMLIAPLFFGGRHGLGALVYSVVVGITAASWLTRQCLSHSKPAPLSQAAVALSLCACLLVTLQLVPLPLDALKVLSSGGGADRLPLWQAGGAFGLPVWSTVTVDPWSTKIGLATLLTHIVLLMVAAQRLKTSADVGRLVRLVAIAGSTMAALGLLLYASRTEYFLWCYPLAYRRVQDAVIGSFTTPNHCGQFLAIGSAAVLYELVGAIRRARKQKRSEHSGPATDLSITSDQAQVILWSSMLALISAAVLLTFSRGALLALGVSLSATAVVLALVGWIDRRVLVRGLGMLLLVSIGLSFAGYDRAAQESGGFDLTDFSEVTDTSSREAIWSANRRAAIESPLLGWGAGAHGQFHQMFLEDPRAIHYTHAESGYLQIASETGLAGLGLLAGSIVLMATWCVRGLLHKGSTERGALCAVCAGALAASLAQSVADFVWYIPACLTPMVLLAAAAMRLAMPAAHAHKESRTPQTAGFPLLSGALFAGACVAAALLSAPGTSSLSLDRYANASAARDRYVSSKFAKLIDGEDQAAVQRVLESQQFYVSQMREALLEVVRRDPRNPTAHLELSELAVQAFELSQALGVNPMGIDAVRQSAERTEFESPGELSGWLARAYGQESRLLFSALHHAKAAVELCPVQGKGYLLIADLRFIESPEFQDPEPWLKQAMVVRPYQGKVLFDVGRHYYYLGRQEQALEMWRRSSVLEGSHRRKLAVVLTQLFPASELVEEFDPDWHLTQASFHAYRGMGRVDDLKALADHSVATARRETEADDQYLGALHWYQAGQIKLSLNEPLAAIECAEHALEYNANQYHFRFLLSQALFGAQRYEEADPHIRWCVSRQPDSPGLRVQLERIAKLRSLAARHALGNRTAIRSARHTRRSASPEREEATVRTR